MTGLCVAIGGWRGLLVAPVLIVVAAASTWAGQRRRTIVQRLTDANDADFERMRREEVARRRRRDGRA